MLGHVPILEDRARTAPPKSTPMAYRLLRYEHVKLINSEVEREGAQQVEFANIKARKINFK